MEEHTPMRSESRSVLEYRSRFGVVPLTRTQQNIRSVTVKQVIDSCKQKKQQGRFVLTNSLLYCVRFCARIIYIDQTEAHTNFKIDDGTGSMDARIWPSNNDGSTDLTGASLNAYYTIVANITINNGTVLLQALNATKVINHNTITMHMLAAIPIHEHCMLAQLKKQDLCRWEEAKTAAKVAVNTTFRTELDKEAIVTLLASQQIRDSDSGVSSDYILNQCHLDQETGQPTLKHMIDEGSIYNTISYNHYKLADNN